VPEEQPIALPQGEDHEIQLTVVKTDGSAFNLTGCEIRLAVRRWLSDASAMFTRVASFVDATAGTAKVVSPAADSAGLLTKKTYWYDVQLTDGSGKRWQIVKVSGYHIDPIVGYPSEPILPPLVDVGAPIAIGPPGPAGPPGAGAVSTSDPLPAGPAALPGSGPEPSAWDHVHPYTIAVAGGADGFMSGAMAQQLADLVAADFGAQIADLSATVDDVDLALGVLTTTVGGHTSSLATLAGDVATLDGDLAALTSTVSGHTSTLASHTSSIGTQGGAISAL
jgi:hypothetical protein